MTIEEIKEKMQQKGYHLHSSAVNRETFNFSKEIVDGLFITCKVRRGVASWDYDLQLSFVWKTVDASSPRIDFNHPYFEIFESDIEKAALMLNERHRE